MNYQERCGEFSLRMMRWWQSIKFSFITLIIARQMSLDTFYFTYVGVKVLARRHLPRIWERVRIISAAITMIITIVSHAQVHKLLLAGINLNNDQVRHLRSCKQCWATTGPSTVITLNNLVFCSNSAKITEAKYYQQVGICEYTYHYHLPCIRKLPLAKETILWVTLKTTLSVL